MSRVIKLNEIIPGKLYQRGQFVTFPVPTKLDMLHKYDIDVVVNLWSRPDSELHIKPGLIYIHWPIGGGTAPFPMWPMITMLLEYMKDNRRVLVHCEAGVNRSVWLVAVLKALHDGISGSQAFTDVQGRISRTKVRAGLLDSLLAIEAP